MKTAKYMGKAKDVYDGGFYKLSEKYLDYEFVVVSCARFSDFMGHPETMIFPANALGEVTSFSELSYCMTLDPGEALAKLGYKMIN